MELTASCPFSPQYLWYLSQNFTPSYLLYTCIYQSVHSPIHVAAVLSQALQFVPPSQTRDAEPPLYSLIFVVSNIPPTYITCLNDDVIMNDSDITREIINPLYMESGESVSVRVKLSLKTRDAATYKCTVGFFKLAGAVNNYDVPDAIPVPELNTSISILGNSITFNLFGI